MAEFNVGTTSDINAWLNGQTPSKQEHSQGSDSPIDTKTVVEKLIPETGEAPPVDTEGDKKQTILQDKSIESLFEGQEVFDKTNSSENYSKIYSSLLENDLVSPLEDNYIPETKEEFLDALSQSFDHKTSKKVDELWEQKMSSLPESLLRIYQYSEKGITTAEQLLNFTQTVSQTEQIASLDINKEEDQEKIVLLQFLNSGTPKEFAESFIEDLKDKDKLFDQAKQVYPALRQSYMEQVQAMELEKQQEWEGVKNWMDMNASNVNYFLDEKNQDYIPFKISSNRDKNEIVALAAQPIAVRENGDITYAWEEKIKNLQNGDEASYKQFMKIMTFLANPSKYEDYVSKSSLNLDKERKFKKIVTTSTTVTPTSTTIRTSTPINKNKWTVR